MLPLPQSQANGDASHAAAAAAASQGVMAATDALQHIITVCPHGADCIVDALELQVTIIRRSQQMQAAAAPAAVSQGPQLQQEDTADQIVQAWALVVRWVVQAAPDTCRNAMVRLAAMAQALMCTSRQPPDCEAPGWDGLQTAQHSGPSASFETARSSGGMQQVDSGPAGQALSVVRSQEYLLDQKGVLQVRTELVGMPCSLCPAHSRCLSATQHMIHVLAGMPLDVLFGRMLLCSPSHQTMRRAFLGRPSNGATADYGQCLDILCPWSEPLSDLQLAILLSIISACSTDAAGVEELDVDLLAHQVC